VLTQGEHPQQAVDAIGPVAPTSCCPCRQIDSPRSPPDYRLSSTGSCRIHANAAAELTSRRDRRQPVRFVRSAQRAVAGRGKAEVADGLRSLLRGNELAHLATLRAEYRRHIKAGASARAASDLLFARSKSRWRLLGRHCARDPPWWW
jgi:hypothetical protein